MKIRPAVTPAFRKACRGLALPRGIWAGAASQPDRAALSRRACLGVNGRRCAGDGHAGGRTLTLSANLIGRAVATLVEFGRQVAVGLQCNVEEPTQWATAKPSASTPRNAVKTHVSRLIPTPEQHGKGWPSDGRDVLS